MSTPVLHSTSRPTTLWTTANVAEAVPGLLTPLTWSLWISAQPSWDQGFHDMGIISDEELTRPLIPDECNMAVFYGRAVMNVEKLRLFADRLPGGSANAAEASIAGRARTGAVDAPDEHYRAIAAEKMPELAGRYGSEMRRLFEEADATWKRWVGNGADDDTWRDILDAGADLFRRAQRYQGMATMFVQGSYSMLAGLVAELEAPGAENTLVSGDGGLDENRLLASLWAVGRGEGSLAEFLADFGFHGPNEGTVESPSWRERPGLLRATLAGYATAEEANSPLAVTRRVAAARSDKLDELVSRATPEQAVQLLALVEQTTALMPLRELGKATFLRGIDLVRMAARHAGAALAAAGVTDDPDDVLYLTISELREDPVDTSRAKVATRRAEREAYTHITLPAVFQGQPEPAAVAVAVDGEFATTLHGMGVSPGVVEGPVRVLRSPADEIEEGDVVVASLTDPSWTPLFLLAGALVVDVGGALSHAAIVARELGVTCVIGTGDATERLRTGDRVVVDGGAGTITVLPPHRLHARSPRMTSTQPVDATVYPPMPDDDELALFVEQPLVALPRLFARYGDPICVPSHIGPMVVTAEPDTAEKVLKNHLSRGPLHRRTEPVQGAGITIQSGPEWRRTRSMINPMFTISRMRALSDLVAEGAARGLAPLEAKAESGEVVDLQAFFPNVTLGVLMHAMLSDSLAPDELPVLIEDYGHLSRWKGGLIKTAFAPAGTPVPFEAEGREAMARSDEIIYRIITERRANPGQRNDLLALLLETCDEEDGSTLTDEEVRNNMTTLFMGGFDTTAFGLTWTLGSALLSPRGLAPLQQVAEVVEGRLATAEDLPALQYLRAAFDEGLRLQGHPLLPRQLGYDDEIGGYQLPSGTMVTISSWVLHRRADLWDRPDEFLPERYIGDENKARNRWQSLAFGGGPRFCVGINFAYLEGTFVLAHLLSRYDLQLVEGWELRPTYVFNVIMEGGLPVTLRRRRVTT